MFSTLSYTARWRGVKLPVHGNGTGHVGVVVAVFRAYVHEHQGAVFTPLAVLDVVQHAGVLAGGDDGQEGEFAGAPADEFVGEEAFYLPFPPSRPDEAE